MIVLRRLPADAVAATINKMMAGQNEKKEEKRRPYWYYDFDSDRNEKKKDTIQGFGIDADIEHNRLLVWATDVEMEPRSRTAGSTRRNTERPARCSPRSPDRADGCSIHTAVVETTPGRMSSSEGNKLIIKLPPEAKPRRGAQDRGEG